METWSSTPIPPAPTKPKITADRMDCSNENKLVAMKEGRYENTKEELRILTNEVSGTLRIGSGLSIGESVLPNILSSYTKNYPLVDTKITIENNDSIVKKVRANDLDIGLISDEVISSDLKSEKLTSDEMVIIIPINHHLSTYEVLNEEQLNNQTWILREKGSGTRSFFDQLITELDLTLKRTFIFNSSQALKESVSSGLGISIVSKSIVKKDVAAGYIKMKRLKNRTMNRGFYIIYRNNYKTTKSIFIVF